MPKTAGKHSKAIINSTRWICELGRNHKAPMTWVGTSSLTLIQHVLCSFSELSTTSWKITYASYSKLLFKELKNGIEILVGEAVF